MFGPFGNCSWSEDDEKKVISVISELELQDSAAEVLHRVTSEPSTSSQADDIFLKLLSGVLQAKDDKACSIDENCDFSVT